MKQIGRHTGSTRLSQKPRGNDLIGIDVASIKRNRN
jgi:hypothetical protein